jgi:sugar lactone lactonase YvrE
MNSKLKCLFVALNLLLAGVACDSNAESNDAAKAPVSDNVIPVIHGVLSLIAGNMDGLGSSDGVGPNAHFSYATSNVGTNQKGITSDAAGNLYVADVENHTIRKITPDGKVTTLAGKAGTRGSADGVGADAQFNYPIGIAIDARGNLYVADSSNYTVRKITPAGVVTTLAGKAREQGWNDGKGSDARFRSPEGIVVNKHTGMIYITDKLDCTVRRISPQGVVTTIAGRSQRNWGFADGYGVLAKFNEPEGITIDRSGVLYVADHGNNAIRRVTPEGRVTTLLGPPNPTGGDKDGPLNTAQISNPSGIGIDAEGNLYVSTNRQLRKIGINGIVSTVAGEDDHGGHVDALGKAASFLQPGGVTVDALGNLFMADGTTVRKITPSGSVTTLAGTALRTGYADGVGEAAQFNHPIDLAADEAGNIYVTDRGNNVVRKISQNGTVSVFAGSIGEGGDGYADGAGAAAKFNGPTGIVVASDGNVYVSDMDNRIIRKITKGGVVTTVAGAIGKKGSVDGVGQNARFKTPTVMISDKLGNLYVADADTKSSSYIIRKIDSAGAVTTMAKNEHFGIIRGMCIDPDGNLFVIDGDTIRKLSPDGVVSTMGDYAEKWTPADTQFGSIPPEAIAADKFGNVYYAVRSKIRKIDPQGAVVAEIDGDGDERRLLGTLHVLPTAASLLVLDQQTIVLQTNSAVLKLTLPAQSTDITQRSAANE